LAIEILLGLRPSQALPSSPNSGCTARERRTALHQQGRVVTSPGIGCERGADPSGREAESRRVALATIAAGPVGSAQLVGFLVARPASPRWAVRPNGSVDSGHCRVVPAALVLPGSTVGAAVGGELPAEARRRALGPGPDGQRGVVDLIEVVEGVATVVVGA